MRRYNLKTVFLALIFFIISDISVRITQVGVNFVVGGIMLALPLMVISFCGLLKESQRNSDAFLPKRYPHFRLMLLYGFLQFFIGNVLFFLAMRFGGLSIASPTVQSQSVYAVIIGAIVFKERMATGKRLSLVAFAAGIALLAYFKSQYSILDEYWYLGIVFGTLGGLTWASAASTQKAVFLHDESSEATLFFGTLFGIACLCITGLVINRQEFAAQISSPSTYIMLLPGIFSGLAIKMVAKALEKAPISIVIPILSLSIVVNTIVGVAVWKEYMNIGIAVALVLVFTGILGSQMEFQSKYEGGVSNARVSHSGRRGKGSDTR